MRRRTAVSIGWGLATVFAFPPLWIALHARDVPRPDDADLTTQASALAADSAAFDALRAAALRGEGLDVPDVHERLRAMLQRQAWEPELVSDLLRRNAGALAALEQALVALSSPNASGNMLVAIAAPNFRAVHMNLCHGDVRMSLLQAAAALRAYAQAEKALPDRLDQLVPRYLDTVPRDRFDGAPLRYAKARAVVYSIGDDFSDAGGSDAPSLDERSEPAIRVAF